MPIGLGFVEGMGERKNAVSCLDESELKAVRPDALSPAEIEAKAESIAVAKAGMKPAKVFVLAMLAGAFISFGALYFCVFLGDPSIPFAVQRVVGGLCFCLGLVLVLCCGAELFTGNSLMVAALASKKISVSAMLKNWAIVWVGNLAGALVTIFLYMAPVHERWCCGCSHGFGSRFEGYARLITLLCIFVCLAVRSVSGLVRSLIRLSVFCCPSLRCGVRL
ncbi:MAG: formate/nitrite transporter family protein [Slackia sp.]